MKKLTFLLALMAVFALSVSCGDRVQDREDTVQREEVGTGTGYGEAEHEEEFEGTGMGEEPEEARDDIHYGTDEYSPEEAEDVEEDIEEN
ncbi:MAG: hypothetical protein Q8K59_11340 [Nitrosomonas sp.]|nr:hypothetical protein [Nitrosomonas sp.]MDP1951661.1 hypothetical protein [Nitrosomonas sp.]